MGAQWLSGRVLDSRLKGSGFEPHRRHCVVSLSKNINPSLVLVQPRKTRTFITERLLMGRKESNQTNKTCGQMNIALLLELHMWADGHLFVIATTHEDRWTWLSYCNHRCGQMDMTLLLQPQLWTDGHDFVIATTVVDRWT